MVGAGVALLWYCVIGTIQLLYGRCRSCLVVVLCDRDHSTVIWSVQELPCCGIV